jgi:hypothetical protein
MNRRRRFVLALMAGAFSAPLASFAQQPARIARVGFLHPASPQGGWEMRLQVFRDGLRELGYVEGKNLNSRFGGGKASSSGCRSWPLTRGTLATRRSLYPQSAIAHRRVRRRATTSGDIRNQGFCRCRWPHLLWTERSRSVSPCGHLRRQNSQGCEAGRSSHRAANQVRVGNKHESWESSGYQIPQLDPAARRPGDRMMRSAWHGRRASALLVSL